MKQALSALILALAIGSLAADQAPANTSTQNKISSSNNTQATTNSRNAVKVDSKFLYEMLALKEIDMDAKNKGVLSQLMNLDALWNTNNNLQNLFQNVNFGAANVGLYYDQSAQAFKLVDLTTNANITIADLVAKMQALATANAAVPTPSGLVDANLGLNLLNLIDLNAGLSLLSGLVDAGVGLNVADIVDVGADVGILSGSQDGGLLDVGADLNVLNLVDAGVGVSVLSGSQDGGSILGLDLGLNVLGLLNLDTSLNVG